MGRHGARQERGPGREGGREARRHLTGESAQSPGATRQGAVAVRCGSSAPGSLRAGVPPPPGPSAPGSLRAGAPPRRGPSAPGSLRSSTWTCARVVCISLSVCCLLKSCCGLLTSRVHAGPASLTLQRGHGRGRWFPSRVTVSGDIGSPCFLKCPDTQNTPTYTYMHTPRPLTHTCAQSHTHLHMRTHTRVHNHTHCHACAQAHAHVHPPSLDAEATREQRPPEVAVLSTQGSSGRECLAQTLFLVKGDTASQE